MTPTGKRTLLLIVFGLLLVVLAACAPQAMEPTGLAQTEAAEVEGEQAVGTPTPAEPAPTTSAGPPATVGPTETPFIEARQVEVEWPARMQLGRTDVIRLALIPSAEGYTVEAEFPDHETEVEPVYVPRPGGYDLFAIARLDGLGFEIAPDGERRQFLPPGESVSWRWSIRAREPGRQRFTLTVLLHWQPVQGQTGPEREYAVYSRGLEVQVDSILGLTQGQALAGGIIGLLLGVGLLAASLRPRLQTGSQPDQIPSAAQVRLPNRELAVEPPGDMILAADERLLLQSLFPRPTRLVIEREFLSGYSGARTFLCLPIHADGRVDAHTIVKVGGRAMICREFENYQNYVKDRLPPVTARIQQPPVVTPPASTDGVELAGLQYTFVGASGRPPVSLGQALRQDPDPALIERLFEIFGPHWWMQRRPYTFRLAQEYDRMLPTHLVVAPADGRGQPLDGSTPPAAIQAEIGQFVRLQNFPVRELRRDGRSLSLEGRAIPGHPPLRVRWMGTDSPQSATGRVIATRASLLAGYTDGCDLFGLPDPLPRLPELLAESIRGSQATIHGDLNLENVLVGPGDLVWLIDFARTGEGHTLADFAHLEAEMIAHILADQYPDPAAYLEMLHGEGHPLLNGLEKIAHRCLFDPQEPREYRLARVMACLGALKFANLDDHARHLLYLTAAFRLDYSY